MATDTKKRERSTGESRGTSPRRDWDRPSYSPLAIMRQGIDEMDRWLGQLGWGGPSGRSFSQMGQQTGDWTPAIEAFQRGNEFVVRAEVPGMSRQDLTVEAGDDSLTIHGERKQEHDEDRDGVYWTERSYGSFTRVIPLPPGTISDSAKASFNNGVLEVVMQAPSAETRRGRRIDISGAPHDGGEKK
jgi:HSP20 family protein